MNQFTEIKKSKKHGLGLFALKELKKGERVYLLKKGKTITYKQIQDLPEEEKLHLYKINEDKYEIIESPVCYINHSCEPNLEERGQAGYALEDIKIGEELTFDYDKIAYLEEPFKCNCGSKNCRGLIYGKGKI